LADENDLNFVVDTYGMNGMMMYISRN
jgi:hypothetical protein